MIDGDRTSFLENRTEWNTQDLRKLCKAVIKHVGSTKNHKIIITYTKRNWCLHGRASINGTWIDMYVFRPERTQVFDVKSFAQVFEHEIGHNLGLRHDTLLRGYEINADYVKNFVVRKKEPKQKAERNVIQERLRRSRQESLQL